MSTTVALNGAEDGAASEASGSSHAAALPKPRWFTPLRLLILFCLANIMVYLDRGTIASNGVNGSPRTADDPQGSGIQGAFNLSNAEDGLLASGFLIGLLIACPIFSEACKHFSAFRLLGIGMGVWVIAVAGCGLAFNFGSLFACRVFVGVGEASFVSLASPFIDDYAPPEKKARWFAFFYLCIPSGYALGYVYGGLIAAALGWRAAFYISAGVMVPFVALMFISRPLHLHGSHDAGPDPTRPKGVVDVAKEAARDSWRVFRHPVWVLMVAGYTMYAAVIGTYAFWGPKAGKEIYHMKDTRADVIYGGVTVIAGIAGGLGGGLLLDWMGSSLRNANLVCVLATWGGMLFALLAFMVAKDFTTFIVLMAIGETLMFAIQAPVGGLGMWSVPPALRPLAISLTTIIMHVIGDVPSPPLTGFLQTHLEAGKDPEAAAQMWRVTLSIITLLQAPAGAFFLWGAFVSRKAKDYRAKEEQMMAEARTEAHLRLSGAGGGSGRASGAGAAAAAAAATGSGSGDSTATDAPLLPSSGDMAACRDGSERDAAAPAGGDCETGHAAGGAGAAKGPGSPVAKGLRARSGTGGSGAGGGL